MKILSVLAAGFWSPRRFAEEMRRRAAPSWGLWAQLARGILVALLVYLPAHVSGRIPPTKPFLTFFDPHDYYLTLVWLSPLVFFTQWLLGGAAAHLVLRLFGRQNDIDQILNITGVATLVVGVFLVAWDWLCFLLGHTNQYFLGISHLVVDIWWIVLVTTGLRRTLHCPARIAVAAVTAALAAGMPFAVIIMRSPF